MCYYIILVLSYHTMCWYVSIDLQFNAHVYNQLDSIMLIDFVRNNYDLINNGSILDKQMFRSFPYHIISSANHSNI